ncbi:MAG: phosphotransferase [Oscillospiraceae bacterium]|nr:phosphotransferase [Oscillospiraceae bacterium]
MTEQQLLDSFQSHIPITKGWSDDKKYCVERDGAKYLLRTSPIARHDNRKLLHEMMDRVAALGVPMCRSLEFGACDDVVYSLQTWIDGEDLSEILLTLPENEQYLLGVKSGEILRLIHSVPAPEGREGWETFFSRKMDTKIGRYHESGLRFDDDERMLDYISENRHLLINRPQCFHHGDYHVGNMMLADGELKIIDFDRYDFGDPWEEYNRIVWTATASPHFATGQLRGYFGGEPPMEFFKLMALYICSNSLSSLPWAVSFGQAEMDVMTAQMRDVLRWYDGMRSVVPRWYQKEVK